MSKKPAHHSPAHIETSSRDSAVQFLAKFIEDTGGGAWIVYTQGYTHIASSGSDSGVWDQYQKMVDDLNHGRYELHPLPDEDDGSCETPSMTVQEIEQRAADIDDVWYEREGTLLERLMELYVEVLGESRDDPEFRGVKNDPLLDVMNGLIIEAKKWKEAAE